MRKILSEEASSSFSGVVSRLRQKIVSTGKVLLSTSPRHAVDLMAYQAGDDWILRQGERIED